MIKLLNIYIFYRERERERVQSFLYTDSVLHMGIAAQIVSIIPMISSIYLGLWHINTLICTCFLLCILNFPQRYLLLENYLSTSTFVNCRISFYVSKSRERTLISDFFYDFKSFYLLQLLKSKYHQI